MGAEEVPSRRGLDRNLKVIDISYYNKSPHAGDWIETPVYQPGRHSLQVPSRRGLDRNRYLNISDEKIEVPSRRGLDRNKKIYAATWRWLSPLTQGTG